MVPTYSSCVKLPCLHTFLAICATRGYYICFGGVKIAYQQLPPLSVNCFPEVNDVSSKLNNGWKASKGLETKRQKAGGNMLSQIHHNWALWKGKYIVLNSVEIKIVRTKAKNSYRGFSLWVHSFYDRLRLQGLGLPYSSHPHASAWPDTYFIRQYACKWTRWRLYFIIVNWVSWFCPTTVYKRVWPQYCLGISSTYASVWCTVVVSSKSLRCVGLPTSGSIHFCSSHPFF